MAAAALLSAVVGILTWYTGIYHPSWQVGSAASVLLFFFITLTHGAVRLGRKVYLVDMTNSDNRAQYVAVSNTVIGVAMLLGGGIGFIADYCDVQAVILILSLTALAAGVYIMWLPDVSG